MSVRDILGGGASASYVDYLFAAFTRTGTGATATVTTGVDTQNYGGLVITKGRSGATGWRWTDTVRGATLSIDTSSNLAQTTDTAGITAFGTTGHTVGSDANYNASGSTYVDYTLRRAPKFFDIVTYAGNSQPNRSIGHSLGVTPGMIVVRRTNTTGDFWTWHTSATTINQYMRISGTDAVTTASGVWGTFAPTSAAFSVGNSQTNLTGNTYICYVFAHDPSPDGVIQCGSFTTDGSGNASVTLGWEPQFVLAKASSTVNNWMISDTSRDMPVSGNAKVLAPNLANAEFTNTFAKPNSTGFTFTDAFSQTYIYIAIRRSNKPSTTGTQVYNAIARTGTGAAATVTGVGFAPDVVSYMRRDGTFGAWFQERLRGSLTFAASSTAAEVSGATAITSFNMDGISLGTDTGANPSGVAGIEWFFKRAPGVFDVVCHTPPNPVTHALGVTPELIITKSRSTTEAWHVWHKSLDANTELVLNTTAAPAVSTFYSAISSTSFTVNGALTGTVASVTMGANGSGYSYAPVVSFSGGGGSGASGTANVYQSSTGGQNAWNFSPNTGSGSYFGIWLATPSVSWSLVSGGGVTSYPSGSLVTRPYRQLSGNGNIPIYSQSPFNGTVPDGTYTINWQDTGTGVFNAPTGTATVSGGVVVSTNITSRGSDIGPVASNGYVQGYVINGMPSIWMTFEMSSATGYVALANGGGLGLSGRTTTNPTVVRATFSGPGGPDRTWDFSVANQIESTYPLYSVSSVTVNTPGSGYATAPAVNFSGDGVGASGTAVLGSFTPANYVSYLFATYPGISKVGNYTGNGGTQTINCGFSGGARFVMIKRTDSTGDWFVWDTARNIITGNDPHLSLNTTVAEVGTDDTIDQNTVGFDVNQVAATNVNVNGATYIYLAFA